MPEQLTHRVQPMSGRDPDQDYLEHHTKLGILGTTVAVALL